MERIIVGGGTLIYRDEWAVRLERVMSRAPDAEIVIAGTGVEDPDYAQRVGVATKEGIRRWDRLIAAASSVAVRGPESRERLAGLGVPVVVSGDPGLLLDELTEGPLRGRGDSRYFEIAVNLASVPDGYAHDRRALLEAIARLPASIDDRPVRVTGFGMERCDMWALDQLRRVALSRSREGRWRTMRNEFVGTASLISTVGRADFVIGERLHAVVAAASLGTPFLAIQYKSKVADFLGSIGCHSFGVDPREPASIDLDGAIARVREKWPLGLEAIEAQKACVRRMIGEALGGTSAGWRR